MWSQQVTGRRQPSPWSLRLTHTCGCGRVQPSTHSKYHVIIMKEESTPYFFSLLLWVGGWLKRNQKRNGKTKQKSQAPLLWEVVFGLTFYQATEEHPDGNSTVARRTVKRLRLIRGDTRRWPQTQNLGESTRFLQHVLNPTVISEGLSDKKPGILAHACNPGLRR